MKRSPLKRTQGLRRKPPAPSTGPSGSNRPSPTAKRSQGVRGRESEPGREEWKKPRKGNCAACGKRGPVFRHHVVRENDVRDAGGDPWDLKNSMDVGRYCQCHNGHHHPGVNDTKFPLSLVPGAAIEFAIELYDAPKAALYMARHYKA